MTLQYLKRLPFDRISNFRDLGGYAAQGDKMTRFGLLYRCDNLSDITEADRLKVLSLGIKTIIDLRTHYEADTAPDRFGGGDGVKLLHVSPLEGLVDVKNATPDELGHLDMGSLYIQMLEVNAPRWREVFGAIAANLSAPLAFHCSAGKDRTGLTAMLLLGCCGVAEADIIADYEVSYTYISRREHSALQKVFQKQAHSEPAMMEKVLVHLEEKYGGVEGYLLHIGVTAEEMEQVRASLLIPVCGE